MSFRRPIDVTDSDLPIVHRQRRELSSVEPLLALCLSGKLYEVEGWISDGRPIQFPPPTDRKLQRRATALQIAVNRRFHSLAALLLVNGYDPNGDYYENLSPAVRNKDHDMVDLLLRYGADPHVVDFCEVLETCDRELMDRFVAAGVDPCKNNAVARSLRFKGRPILGFIKQYRDQFPCLQRQIDIALHGFTEREELRGIALMLWLGADPHAETPTDGELDVVSDLNKSAFETALWAKDPGILVQFLKRPIPANKALGLLQKAAYRRRPDLVRRLLKLEVDLNMPCEEGFPLLHGYIAGVLWRYGSQAPDDVERGFEALELLLQAGAKWQPTELELKRLRRDLAEGQSKVVVRLLELLRKYEAFTLAELHELTRTPAVRRVLNGHSKPFRDPFAYHYTLPPPPVAPEEPSVKRPYWKRHWSQR